jgi:hypothetical protein
MREKPEHISNRRQRCRKVQGRRPSRQEAIGGEAVYQAVAISLAWDLGEGVVSDDAGVLCGSESEEHRESRRRCYKERRGEQWRDEGVDGA